MQFWAANWPQMMQIGVGIMKKSCKSALIEERGQIYANQKGAKGSGSQQNCQVMAPASPNNV